MIFRQVRTIILAGVFFCLVSMGRVCLSAWGQDVVTPPPTGDAMRLDAVEQARQGHYLLALSLIQEVLKMPGDTTRLMYDQAVIFSWSDQYEKAIEAYEELAAKTPPPDYVIPEMARCYRLTGNFSKALGLYQDYLANHPGDKNAIKGIIYTHLDAKQDKEAEQFIRGIVESESAGRSDTTSFIGDVFLARGAIDEAEKIYTRILKQNFDDVNALLGLSRVLIAKGQGPKAVKLIDQVLSQEPKNFQALVARGEVMEEEHEYLKAYDHYGAVSEIYPRSAIVTGLRYRSLSELGATSLVQEKIAGLDMDPEIKRNIMGDVSMARVRWNEPAAARDIIRTSLDEAAKDSEKNKAFYHRPFVERFTFDEIAALRQQDDAKAILRIYEELKNMDVDLPAWTCVQVADAYLYLQKPEIALQIYKEALSKGYDPDGATRMALFDALIELGRYREADTLLAEVDRDTPVQTIRRGVFRDNWAKEDIQISKAWSLLYQDRLAEANAVLDDLLSKAPSDTHIQTALGHAYLWRGWPRKALQEFQISESVDDKGAQDKIGLAYALNENDRGKEARALASQLGRDYPTNTHVQRLNRAFEVQDKRTLTIDAVVETEGSDFGGVTWSARVDQPLQPWRSLFAEYIYRESKDDVDKSLKRRWLLGADWRLNRDLWFTGGFSIDEDGRDAGHFESLTLTPDDHWLFSAAYDSYALDLPLRAAVTGVTAQDYSFIARYRSSELFNAETSFLYRPYSDGNKQYVYGLRLDRALTTAARWKTRLALDGSAEFYTDQDVPYFSPESLYAVYLVPMVEHTWFQRYEHHFIDRLFVGLGEQWEKSFGSNNVWYVRYEQDHKLSDIFSILFGVTYAKRYYDGEAENAVTGYATIKYRF